MKGQFFIISSVIMVYILLLTFQYISSFNETRLTQTASLQEVYYVEEAKEVLLKTFYTSNATSNGDYNKIVKDISYASQIMKEEMLRNNVRLESNFLLFSNGFETEFDKWSSISGTPEISYNSYDGYRSMRCNNIEYVNKYVQGLSEVYTRVYVNFQTLPVNGRNYFIGLYEDSNRVIILALNESGGAYKLRAFSDPTSSNYYSSEISIGADEWHYFELYWMENGTDSRIKAWYDGALMIDTKTNSVGEGKNINSYRVGGVAGNTPDILLDCFAASGDYIGEQCFPDKEEYFSFNIITDNMRATSGFTYYFIPDEYEYEPPPSQNYCEGVLCLYFDEGIGGTTAYDNSSYGNDGTLFGMEPGDWVDGVRGKALDFDGSGDEYVRILDDDSLDLSGDITISAWIYPRSWGGGSLGRIVDKRTSAYALYLLGGNSAMKFWGGSVAQQSDDNSINLGRWQHVALVFNRTNVKFFVDGNLVSQPYDADNIGSNNEVLYVGNGWIDTNDRAFDGIIDEVRIWDRELSDSEILDLYNEIPKTCSPDDSSCTMGYDCCTGNCTGGTCGPGTYCGQPCSDAGFPYSDNTHAWNIWPGDCQAKLLEGQGDCDCDDNCRTDLGLYCNQLPDEDYCCPVGEEWDGDSCESTLVAYWKFDEGSGFNAEDSSTNSNDGTLINMGSGSWRSGSECISGSCLLFDNDNDAVIVPDDDSLDINDTFTLSAWIKPKGWGENGMGRIINKYTSSTGYIFYLADWNNAIKIYSAADPLFEKESSSYSINLNVWQHVAVTFNRTHLVFYVNGIQRGIQTSMTRPYLGINVASLYIGGSGFFDRTFNGTIDEVKIWNKALSPAEIDNEYRQYPVAIWNFDEGTGSTAFDSSINSNDGTLRNIYPLDVIAQNPSLEDPWYSVNNQDANHRIERPQYWTSQYIYDTASTMLTLENNTIVKDGSSSVKMKVITGDSFVGSQSITSDYSKFSINENSYLEVGVFVYPILGSQTYGDQSLYFYNSTGHFMCRRWAYDTTLDTSVGDGWRMRSVIWQPSSMDPNPPSSCDGNDPSANIPYIPVGATSAYHQQFYVWRRTNTDFETVFDKFFIYQWANMPTSTQRINRASSGWVFGKQNQGIRFDGINDYVEVPYDSTLKVEDGNFTITAWINGTDSQRAENIYIVSLYDDFGLRVALGGNDNLGIWYRLASGSTGSYDTGYQVLDDTWKHIAVVKRNNDYSFYVNGTYIGGTSLGQGLSVQSNVRRIGSWSSTYGLFSGLIDNVKIWGRALSEDEITQEYEKNTFVFQDSFESGDFSSWDNNVENTGVVGDPVHSGFYSAKGTIVLPATRSWWGYDLSGQDDVYFSGWFYLKDLPNVDTILEIMRLGIDGMSTSDIAVNLYRDATGTAWRFSTPSGSVNNYASIQTDRWYYVQIRRKTGSGNGVSTLWIDGQMIENRTSESQPTGAYQAYAGIVYAQDYGGGINGKSVYGDDFTINTRYIP